MAVQGFDQHLHRGDKDVEGLGEQGDGRVEFDFHNKGGGSGDMRARRGPNVYLYTLLLSIHHRTHMKSK